MALQLGYILLIVLLIPIIVGVVKIVKEGWSLPAAGSLLFSIVALGVGIMLQLDTTDFTNNFESSPKTILLADMDRITGGFVGVLKPESPPMFLDQKTLDEYTVYYQRGELEKLKRDSYKLIIVKRPAFDAIESVSFAGEDISREDVFAIMDAEDPLDTYADRIVEAAIQRSDIVPEYREEAKKQYLGEIQQKIGDRGQLRSSLFGVMISEATTKLGPLFLLNSYHTKEAIIHKETFMFKIIKLIPSRILKFASKKDIPIISSLLGRGG